ncbi:hypothetical protein GQ457_04G012910 [Hibiscus cannabinus]
MKRKRQSREIKISNRGEIRIVKVKQRLSIHWLDIPFYEATGLKGGEIGSVGKLGAWIDFPQGLQRRIDEEIHNLRNQCIENQRSTRVRNGRTTRIVCQIWRGTKRAVAS